jgi:hypothetical protein
MLKTTTFKSRRLSFLAVAAAKLDYLDPVG